MPLILANTIEVFMRYFAYEIQPHEAKYGTLAPCAIITFASSNAKFGKSETRKRSGSAHVRLHRPPQAQAHPKAVLNRRFVVHQFVR